MLMEDIGDEIVIPTLAFINLPRSKQAALLLVAIAGQESDCCYRFQRGTGPARSYWQIESPTARAVLNKWTPAVVAATMLDLDIDQLEYWLPYNDTMACILARGILWLEPTPLPQVGDMAAAWDYYAVKCWRPGKPRPETWELNYRRASKWLNTHFTSP